MAQEDPKEAKTPIYPSAQYKLVSEANSRQVGGNHYKLGGRGEEHWDRVWRMHGRGYFVGCITKYVERYHLKNGVQDLEKARHFLDKLIELESAKEGERPVAREGTR